ncbi:MAG: DUF4912 domain-containing protein [Spirochaetaceae bacterium]|jgi:hypothetical protein|nr:DUF4912 domain-containing protein [Spirochaetaceae bacterium]
MEHTCSKLTRQYLDHLTTHELLALADLMGLDVPTGLDRIFLIEELITLAQDPSSGDDLTETEIEKTKLLKENNPKAVSLPAQYNITFIHIMIRDPLWVFVFWEVKSHDREMLENNPNFDGYYLKASPIPVSSEEAVFTITVGTTDNAWYLSFPPEQGTFQVALCARCGQEEITLIVSDPFTLPNLFDPAHIPHNNPLIQLSGAEFMPILHKVDRVPRRTRSGTEH